MGVGGSGAKCHSVWQAAQPLSATETDSKSCRSVKIKTESCYFHLSKEVMLLLKKARCRYSYLMEAVEALRGLCLVAFDSSVPWVLC